MPHEAVAPGRHFGCLEKTRIIFGQNGGSSLVLAAVRPVLLILSVAVTTTYQWARFDIIEWIHDEENVSTTLHTKAGCTQSHLREGKDMKAWWNPGIYGRGKASNCDVHAQGQWQNQGCSQRGLAGTVGPSFNAGGGGTYAAEWDPLAGHMRVWFWPSGSEPEDAKGPTPDPELWGQPDFYFELSDVCTKSHFKNMKLVFDITFCGDLGSPTFHEHCGAKAAKAGHSNCEAFVRQELLKRVRVSVL